VRVAFFCPLRPGLLTQISKIENFGLQGVVTEGFKYLCS